MKLKPVLILALTLLSFAPGAAFADHCINKDLINLGPTAYDLAVILWGRQPITWHYDGYPDLRFHSFTRTSIGFNTKLHWQNGNGVNAPIPPGKLVHVGWCTPRHHNIFNMYWTDLAGRRIPGSIVFNLTTGWVYCGGLRLRLQNIFQHQFEAGALLNVQDVQVAVLPAPLPLAELNRQNFALNSQLVPVPGGEAFTIEPGDTVELPVAGVFPGQTVVVRYRVTGSGGTADSVDFVQFTVEGEGVTSAAAPAAAPAPDSTLGK
jgi:hypothetical protein